MKGKKRMLAALGTMALAALLISAGTFALFTDQATNEGNTFASGTLTIEDITNGDGSAAVEVSNLAPGDNTVGVKEVTTECDQWIWLPFFGWQCVSWEEIETGEDATHEPATITIVNDGSLDAWIQLSDVEVSGQLFDGDHPITIGVDADPEDPVKFAPGETREYTVNWSFPLEAGNEYQGENGEATFHFEAVQSDNNINDDGDGPNSWNEDAS